MTKVMPLLFHQSLASLRDVQSFDKKDKAQPTMAMEGLGVPTPSFPLPKGPWQRHAAKCAQNTILSIDLFENVSFTSAPDSRDRRGV